MHAENLLSHIEGKIKRIFASALIRIFSFCNNMQPDKKLIQTWGNKVHNSSYGIREKYQ